MNKERIEHIERWAEYVRNNKDWKKIHTQFINSQFEISMEFYKRLAKLKGGKEKIIKLFDIKNKEAIPSWLR